MPLALKNLCFAIVLSLVVSSSGADAEPVNATRLRCEYLDNPIGIDTVEPRLSYRIESEGRGVKQTAYRILVASSAEKLAAGEGDLWDSGKVDSDQTLFIEYAGEPLRSRQRCQWKVQVWSNQSTDPVWSKPASWSMGLLQDSDWSAQYVTYEDTEPIHTDVKDLYLPAARQYRKAFAAEKEIAHATVYATALGIYELHLNGQRVGDAYFAPGWTDYDQRAYYNTYDVSELVREGDNAIGAWVADGWYSGYVGFGLLTGMGTERTGRATYGKTPALMAQLEIQYTDGTREIIGTDASWKVTGDGPIQEADLLMGEAYDARQELTGWASPDFDDSGWQQAILAADVGNIAAEFFEGRNPTKLGAGPRISGEEIDLGFERPKLEAFPGVPVRITEEISAKKVTQRESGTYVFDLGQNFAGVIRLKVKGPAGTRVQIRYGEMLHPDGRLMTENLRKARATDFYTLSGDPEGEIYQPRFTFHGFQFVEVQNFPGEATLETVTGLVMHSDTPMTSEFACSDPMVNRLFQNVLWTQRSNFLDLPTDCPQRDERMGWTGDAQAYVATAAYNADIGAFYTKWLRELMESQRPSGAFPGYAPFPFQHGWDFGTAWADAGVICPWTLWQAYGDTRVIETCWEPMTRFMEWRVETSVDDLGITHGNPWGDWLAQGAETPLDYVDTIYFAISAKMMSEMAAAIGRDDEAAAYRDQFQRTRKAFQKKYVQADGSISVTTQTAQALALFADLVPPDLREATGRRLAEMLAENGNHMATGFLGTRPLLPVLSGSGQHDLATFLLQSREFPSWGYEIENGATTIWERWDSYTKEDAFGRHNAAMNSFSHYAFGAVCEWMFQTLAGIQSDGPGYKKIIIRPSPPSPGSNAMHEPIDWVRASYDSIRGTIRSDWRVGEDGFELNVEIPANTTATIYLPATQASGISEGGKRLDANPAVKLIKVENGHAVLSVGSGRYAFLGKGLPAAKVALKTSKPKDNSINPLKIDLAGAKELVRWDFTKTTDLDKWFDRKNLEIEQRDGKTYLVAAGDDSQMAVRLPGPAEGRLVIEMRAMPESGATSQFFWAGPTTGFNAIQQSKRSLMATDQVNAYLFSVTGQGPVTKIRFDPFATYDKYAEAGEMLVESIAVYQLPDEKPAANQPAPAKADDAKTNERPNILFVLTEDQGAHMSFLGTPGLETPHMDSIARSGVYFKNAFVAYPVCSASKAAFYTGMHSHTNGILNNTHNYHKPADQVTEAERGRVLARTNRIRDSFLTLPEVLKANGYYQGVTHKLHVLPNEKFPYDEFLHGSAQELAAFIEHAGQQGKPWFLLVNIANSHRPYPNSDKEPIRVDPAQIELPEYLPDSPPVRKDWAEYLAGIEEADALTGQALQVLDQSGQRDKTIVVFMSDHGPTFQHGKMTLYDLGLRVPLIFSGPGIKSGLVSDALASELDLMPTLLDSISTAGNDPVNVFGKALDAFFGELDGLTLLPLLSGQAKTTDRQHIFAEISNRGPLPNDGIQERSVMDERFKLIYRENVEMAWRQVNADSRQFKLWGNRTYRETIRLKDKFPRQYRVLAEMDPQNLGGQVPALELYDLKNDPDEMNNLVGKPGHEAKQQQLIMALQKWVIRTKDPAVTLRSLSLAN